MRRQETASVKDFSTDTSKKEITAPKIDTSILTTVLLNGHCKPVTIELAKLSAVSIWRQSRLVQTLDLDYLCVKQTNLQTKQIFSTFREICTVYNNTVSA